MEKGAANAEMWFMEVIYQHYHTLFARIKIMALSGGKGYVGRTNQELYQII